MKKIKHFMLPTETNMLYEKESASSISLTKEVANKLNEMIDYINTFDNNLEKELEQDGRIEKGIIFMKENLKNSLIDLLDGMVHSGEINRLIGETITELYPMYEKLRESVSGIDSLVYKNMKFYLPNGKDYSYGQFMMLGVTNTKSCLFDLGHVNDSDYNLNYLKRILGSKKLDYVFISHYHGDHYGGLEKFSELYTPNTKFFIAKDSRDFYTGTDSEDVNNAYDYVTTYLNVNNLTYTMVNDTTIIELEKGITLSLYNNSNDAYTYYKTKGIDDFNNYSMVIDVNIHNKHVLLGFDGAEITQEYLLLKGLVNKSEVLFNFHHGNYNISNREYMLKLNPDIVVDTLPPFNLENFDGTESFTNRPFYNAKYLSNARNEVILNVNSYSTEIIKGDVKVNSIRNHDNVEVYLNTDYEGFECIGSIEKPFKTFNQIFEIIPKSCQSITVNVSGSRILTNQRIYNTFNKLMIKGNPNSKTEFYDFQIDNSQKVEISDIKFVDNTVHLFNSDVRFTNCEFTSPKTQNVSITNSRVSFNTCNFLNATREGILMTDKSVVRLNGCNINANTYGVNGTDSTLYIKGNTINGTTNYYRLSDASNIIADKVGSTADRPDFGESYYCNGYTYFDSEINRLIYYDYDSPTSKWKTTDGVDV